MNIIVLKRFFLLGKLFNLSTAEKPTSVSAQMAEEISNNDFFKKLVDNGYVLVLGQRPTYIAPKKEPKK